MLSSDSARRSFDWMSQGACQREDPELFFPIAANGAARNQVDAAKAVCRACAVCAACLAFGLKTGQDGIWGGTTSEERAAIRAQASHDARKRVGPTFLTAQAHPAR
jgi:WhiB family redox-sensing transcriptional regulator